MKWISNVLIILFCRLIAVQYFDNEKLKQELGQALSRSQAQDSVIMYQQMELNKGLISEVVFHARDPKTKDFFTFIKLKGKGKEGYEIISDVKKIDRLQFDLIYDVLIDSMADLNFAMENLWGESRVGANQKHEVNKDGSIDFGWFGKNYPRGTNPIKVGVVQQARDYCKFVNENNLMGYPPEQRRSRYYSKYYWQRDLK